MRDDAAQQHSAAEGAGGEDGLLLYLSRSPSGLRYEARRLEGLSFQIDGVSARDVVARRELQQHEPPASSRMHRRPPTAQHSSPAAAPLETASVSHLDTTSSSHMLADDAPHPPSARPNAATREGVHATSRATAAHDTQSSIATCRTLSVSLTTAAHQPHAPLRRADQIPASPDPAPEC
jgi:hypothetical protein